MSFEHVSVMLHETVDLLGGCFDSGLKSKRNIRTVYVVINGFGQRQNVHACLRQFKCGAMRAVFESVGVQNVLAKSKGSSNPHNLVKATVAALTELRDAYTVAGLRGVPMSKVFNG